LDDIRLLFKLKKSYGCGSPQLIHDVAEQFTAQIDSLNQQIAALEGRRDRLRGFLDELAPVMNR
jgi:ABC-type transporter Mla subunit MlaD